jgi:WD40 repeat protein
VLSAGEDGKVAFWNAPELERVRAIQTHQAEDAWSSGLQSLAILDERHVLAGGGDGRLLCVDLDTGAVTALGTSGDRSLTALRVAVDGRFAVSGSSDGAVERWPLNAGGQALPEPLGDVSEVRSLVVAPDGSHAIVGDLDGIVTSFAVDPAEPSVQLHGHVNYVDALAMPGDGRLLVTGGWDRTLRLWNLVAQEEVGRYTWEVPIARAATVAREGREVVAVGDHQGAVFFLRIENGTV